jgi:hypothetical protein
VGKGEESTEFEAKERIWDHVSGQKGKEGASSKCHRGCFFIDQCSPLSFLQSKSSIRAELLAKRREKTKRRKDARKAVAAATSTAEHETPSAPQESEGKGKRVSFA